MVAHLVRARVRVRVRVGLGLGLGLGLEGVRVVAHLAQLHLDIVKARDLD